MTNFYRASKSIKHATFFGCIISIVHAISPEILFNINLLALKRFLLSCFEVMFFTVIIIFNSTIQQTNLGFCLVVAKSGI